MEAAEVKRVQACSIQPGGPTFKREVKYRKNESSKPGGGVGGKEEHEQRLSVIREDSRQILHVQNNNASLLELYLNLPFNRPSWGDSSPV